MAHRARGSEAPIRITTAGSGAVEDVNKRQRRYLIAMGVRTACFLAVALIAITGFGPGWLAWIFVIGALVLPYVAVVMANATDTKSDAFELLDGGSPGHQLPPGTKSDHSSD